MRHPTIIEVKGKKREREAANHSLNFLLDQLIDPLINRFWSILVLRLIIQTWHLIHRLMKSIDLLNLILAQILAQILVIFYAEKRFRKRITHSIKRDRSPLMNILLLIGISDEYQSSTPCSSTIRRLFH